PRPPDPDLTRCLVRALAATIQVRGNFFTAAGRAAAVPAMAAMLVERRVNGAGAYVDPPPRLARLEAARSRLRVEPVAEPGHEEAHGIGQAAAARVAHFFEGLNELLGFAKAER